MFFFFFENFGCIRAATLECTPPFLLSTDEIEVKIQKKKIITKLKDKLIHQNMQHVLLLELPPRTSVMEQYLKEFFQFLFSG